MTINLNKLFQLACEARDNAYAPYSQFAVGACIVTKDEKYFSGCNVENAAFVMGQCAEASALGSMVSKGSSEIAAIMVVADTAQPIVPCGGCLQKIGEFSDQTTDIICRNLTGDEVRQPFLAFLPMAFDKQSLRSQH